MWKLNDILLSTYGIIPGQVEGEDLAVKGIFDLPKRSGTTFKDWDDQNSVEPYVESDEIFLEGRNITFHGILEGTKADTESNIELLKTDISNFNNIVPFETPYGSYCVYVKQITPKIHKGIATIIIEFREPQVGGTCGIGGTETTYYSQIYNETAVKNNCPVGYHGLEVSLASTLGQFTSNISQYAANLLAVAWVRENKQDKANAALEGTYCDINPPIFYNTEQTKSIQRNDCATGYTGSAITKKIDKETYSSFVSVADANAKAQAELDILLTQEYANATGTCEYLVSFKRGGESFFAINSTQENYGVPVGTRIHAESFIIGSHIEPGTKYSIMIYGITRTVTAVDGDTPASLNGRLRDLINGVTNWNLYNRKRTSDINPIALPNLIFGSILVIWTSELAYVSYWIGEPPTWDIVDLPNPGGGGGGELITEPL